MKRLMILDGNSIVNRAFYGIRLLTNSEGLYTNAVYGFVNILFKYLDEEKPDYLCVAFDVSAPTFRHIQYEKYKAQRKGMPDELRQQMPLLKEVLSAMNISMLELEGYEADDIIGTISNYCDKNDTECVIITGDKDDLQLATEKTRIKLITTRTGNSETVDYVADTVKEKYGVTPAEFIDVKGLMGDPSDNIPGVAGIGEKTAFELIQRFKSIERIYQDLYTIDIKDSVRKKLAEGKEIAFISKTLATIDVNVPINYSIEDFLRSQIPNYKVLASVYKIFEYKVNVDQNYDPKDFVNTKYTLVEHLIGKTPSTKTLAETTIHSDLKKEDKEIQLLSYKMLIDSFNKKYNNLNDKQKGLLKEYINSFTNSDNLKNHVVTEVKTLIKEFKTISSKINDKVTKIKLAETINQLAKIGNSQKIKDNHITSLIMCYELEKELSDVHKGII